MPNIALLTCQRLPDLFETDHTLIPRFEQFGIKAEAAIWNDPSIDWKKYDALIIRNTWDYYTQSEAFINWLERIRDCDIPVLNPVDVVLRNIHKFYLREFENKGILIVPTIFSDHRKPVLPEEMNRRGWNSVVIKPAVSAGSYQTKIYPVPELTQQTLSDLLSGSDWLIQPFLPEIQQGELSMIFFRGSFSHAVVKKPKHGDFRVQRQYGGQYQLFHPDQALLRVAEEILAQIPQQLLFARVDGVMIADKFHLMELELIEPDLYFEFDEAIKLRFVEAVVQFMKK